jgi:hypothetical protein
MSGWAGGSSCSKQPCTVGLPARRLWLRRRRGGDGSRIVWALWPGSIGGVSAGVAASPQGRVRPGPGRSDRGGGGPAELVPGHRKTWHWDSGKTSLRRVRTCGLPGGRWSAHALWRVGPASYRSSQCVRTGRTCEDAATSLRRLGIQRNRSRWEESKRRFQVWRSFRLLLGFTCRRPLTTLRWRVSGAEGKGHRRQRSGSTSRPARSQCPVSAAAP